MTCAARSWPSLWKKISDFKILLRSVKFTMLHLLAMAFLSKKLIIIIIIISKIEKIKDMKKKKKKFLVAEV